MATGVNAKIAELLFDKVEQLSTDTGYEIAYPNVDFTPPASGRYLSVMIIPVPRRGPAFGPLKLYQGILQIDVVHPHGEGAIAPKEVIEAIEVAFPQTLKLFTSDDLLCVEIDSQGNEAVGIVDGASYRVPVSIPFRAFI